MAEYIDREMAIRELEREYVTLKDSLKMAESRSAREVFYLQMGQCRDVISALEATPLVDVAPVRHAQWHRPYISWFFPLKIKDSHCYCTYCGNPVNHRKTTNYCSYCGAKMDGGKDNAAD